MGRAPCCDKANVKKGPWSPEEDAQLKGYIDKYGTGGNWISLPQRAGLRRCGKSCRLRWLNYLRPNIKHGEFSEDEDKLICSLFASIGSRWSIIAAQLPGRTDNDIKNYWNTKLKKKLMVVLSQMQPLPPQGLSSSSQPTSTYKNTSTTTHHLQTKSLPFLEPISIPSNLSLEGLVPPTPMHKDSVLPMYGGEPSCSPSDGICNQIGLERYYCNGVEENQKFMVGGQNRNGFWGETGLEYDIEEIKRLVSTNDCNNFFSEETKPQGRVMYF